MFTDEGTALSVTRFLDAVCLVDSDIRFYQISSREIIGKDLEAPQTENIPFYPRSPYGVAKVSKWSNLIRIDNCHSEAQRRVLANVYVRFFVAPLL